MRKGIFHRKRFRQRVPPASKQVQKEIRATDAKVVGMGNPA
jgi:hypothetical protein